MGEAARAVGKSRESLYKAIKEGRLVATKSDMPIFPANFLHWEIDPDELFKVWPQEVEVIPGLNSVSSYYLRYQILCGCRPDEARRMRWPEYKEGDGVWVIPWQRLKRGRTRQHRNLDHHLPLSKPAIEILATLFKHQVREGLYRPDGYVFGNYRTYNPTSARMGCRPPSRPCAIF
jgi:integrase